MPAEHKAPHSTSTGIWTLAFVCMGLVIFILCSGAAYSAVSATNERMAMARLEHIETAFLLAQERADASGLSLSPSVEEVNVRSFEHPDNGIASEYERYVLSEMLEVMGADRDFDFAVRFYEDENGAQMEVHYFPVLGLSNPQNHTYYLSENGVVVKQ